ncbi:MAG TPA: D-Ala-D-Ala carboxypeptidase family metallohydrolase [Solirubrobacteraceae bacterium]|nr:D-Ala-D-Ala carboxypeptidase family metallohydrolase [Solirubrobacteraceae bacterium]
MQHPGTRRVALTVAALVAAGLALVAGGLVLATGHRSHGSAAAATLAAAPPTARAAATTTPAETVAATTTTTAPAGRETSLDVARHIAALYRLRITSGYRTPAENAAVGGVEGSYHTRGTPENPGAVDMVGSIADMRRALDWARLHVPNLAEGIIHSVCLSDQARPWLVSDGGLHLHLAFAASADAPDARSPDLMVDLGSGCRTAATRFAAAMGAVQRLRQAGALSEDGALAARRRVAQRALDGGYGTLDAATRKAAEAWRGYADAHLSR